MIRSELKLNKHSRTQLFKFQYHFIFRHSENETAFFSSCYDCRLWFCDSLQIMLDATIHATKMIYRPILISQAVRRKIHYHPRDAKQQLSRRSSEKIETSEGILVPWSEKAKKMGKKTHSQAEKWQCARSVVLWFFFSIFTFRTSSRRRKHVHNGITSCWQSFCRQLLFNIDSNTDTSNQSENNKSGEDSTTA